MWEPEEIPSHTELLDITITFNWNVKVAGFKLSTSFRKKTRTRDT
jgi:hypothetical protein